MLTNKCQESIWFLIRETLCKFGLKYPEKFKGKKYNHLQKVSHSYELRWTFKKLSCSQKKNLHILYCLTCGAPGIHFTRLIVHSVKGVCNILTSLKVWDSIKSKTSEGKRQRNKSWECSWFKCWDLFEFSRINEIF